MKQYEVTVREVWDHPLRLWAEDEADAREQAELLLANRPLIHTGEEFVGVDIIITEAPEDPERKGVSS